MLTSLCTLRLPCSVLLQSAFARYGFETASAAHVRFSAPIDSGAFVPSGSQDEITACRICSVVCLPQPAGIRRAGGRGAAALCRWHQDAECAFRAARSEERRVGKELVSTGRCRWLQ